MTDEWLDEPVESAQKVLDEWQADTNSTVNMN